MAHVRMDPEERKKLIADAAYKVARRHGMKRATRTAIAKEAGVTPALVGRYMGGRDEMRTAIMQMAIKFSQGPLVREALDMGVTPGMRIPKELRAA